MKAEGSVIALNGVIYLQFKSVGSHSTPGRQKEGKDWKYQNKINLYGDTVTYQYLYCLFT